MEMDFLTSHLLYNLIHMHYLYLMSEFYDRLIFNHFASFLIDKNYLNSLPLYNNHLQMSIYYFNFYFPYD
jgi:hypothetical protein